MKYTVTCDQAGCGFFIRAPGRALAGAWLWSHLCGAHGTMPDTLDLQALGDRAAFDQFDTQPDCGKPWGEAAEDLTTKQTEKTEGMKR